MVDKFILTSYIYMNSCNKHFIYAAHKMNRVLCDMIIL